MIFGSGFQPDRVRAAFEQLPRFGIGNDRTAGRNDETLILGQQLQQDIVGQALVVGLAVHREQLGERKIGFLFHAGIQFHQPCVKMLGERLSDRRFAGAAQANQRDARGVRVFGGHQRNQRYAEGAGEIRQPRHRNISFSGFNVREKSRGYPGTLRHFAQCPVHGRAPRPDAGSDLSQKRIHRMKYTAC